MIIDSANLTGSVAIEGQLADPLDFFTREGWVDLMSTVSSMLPVFGDVKCSYATTDHNGWYRMTPGRPVTSFPHRLKHGQQHSVLSDSSPMPTQRKMACSLVSMWPESQTAQRCQRYLSI